MNLSCRGPETLKGFWLWEVLELEGGLMGLKGQRYGRVLGLSGGWRPRNGPVLLKNFEPLPGPAIAHRGGPGHLPTPPRSTLKKTN